MSDARATEALIASLAAQTRPVRPLASPWRRAGAWLVLATLILSAITAWFGLRPGLGALLMTPRFDLELLGAVATGGLSIIAAFHLALPDRSARWALAPVPALGAWLATLSGGCYADFVTLGPDGLHLGTSFHCFQTIVFTSLALAVPLLVMIRHAGPIRPGLTACLGGLGVAALASAALTLFHGLSTAIMIIVWHMGSTALVTLAVWALRGPAFALATRLAQWGASDLTGPAAR